MKRTFTFLSLIVLLAIQVQAQVGIPNALYPGLTDSSLVYKAPKTAVAPIIDGDPIDDAWKLAPWKSALRVANYVRTVSTVVREEPAGPFSGVADCEFKYKFIWDNDRYYLLMYWKDDNVIYSDLHDGYGKMPVKPDFLTGVTMPADGAGDGTAYKAYLMDQISIMVANYSATWAGGTGFARANNSLWYNFYPAMVTESTRPGAILWGQSNNLPTGVTEIQKVTVACKYNAVEKAYYIEFADAKWDVLFGTVKNAALPDQKNFATTPVAIGDKFIFSGEVNDADSKLSLRDYALYIGAKLVNPNNNASEAAVIELVDKIVGVDNTSLNNEFKIFPNPNSTDILNLNCVTDVEILNIAGQQVLNSFNSSIINIAGLKQGVYVVKDNKGNVRKMIRK